ncbi:SDR family NAD(P)-dependent oxidoreductase [Ascidiimonas sp. W6]|uniref:SDR family NAD(P)-dependent oxidoreductase n=1 Tax=Ascidiimonas meishanensis TaxID=3128903 RepID=UPI0030EB4985
MNLDKKAIITKLKNKEITPQQASKLFHELAEKPKDLSKQDEHKTIHNASFKNAKEQFIWLLQQALSQEIEMPIDRIKAHVSFEKYGLDSVMILNITRKLEDQFGELPKTLFFEYLNLDSLSDYFVDNFESKLSTIFPEKESNTSDTLKKEKTVSKKKVSDKQSGDVAIIGMNCRFPQAENPQMFWENLKNGKDCITEIPIERWDHSFYYDPDKEKEGTAYSKWGGFISDYDKFDASFFNITPREAELMDPQERIFLESVWHTMEDSGYTRETLANSKVGVFVGVMYSHYQLYGAEAIQNGTRIVPGSSYATIANRVSYYCNFNGPSIALDTMCSSSLTAIHLAIDSLMKSESDVAIAGGVNLTLHPAKHLYLSQGKFASSEGKCRAFGADGDGYVPGEGVGAVMLKPIEKAIQDGDQIYAVIKSSRINHGGKTNGYTVPSPTAQGKLISEAIESAGIDIKTLSYLEAHGTGTSLGDPIEIKGLKNAFNRYDVKKQFCPIGSVKSNIGHLESAAGISGVIKILLQMKYRKLVPSIHSENLNPNIKFEDSFFFVQQKLENWEQPFLDNTYHPRRAGISSFGAGGANAHIILEEFEDSLGEYDSDSEQLIVLSAKTEEALKKYVQNFIKFLSHKQEIVSADYLADLSYTLRVGREPMKYRLAFLCSTLEECLDRLNAYNAGLFDGCHHGKLKNNMLPDTTMDLSGMNKNDIADLWAKGEIDLLAWESLRPTKRNKVSAPVYPFERERYWISYDSKNSLKVEKKLDFSKVYTFIEESAHAKTISEVKLPEQLLLFDQDVTNLQWINKNYPEIYVILITRGKEFKQLSDEMFELNPIQKDQFITLLEVLQKQNKQPSKVLNLWGLKELYNDEEQKAEHFFIETFNFIQSGALKRIFKGGFSFINLFSSKEQENSIPTYQAADALFKSVELEIPEFTGKTIETSYSDISQFFPQVIQEFSSTKNHHSIKLSNQERTFNTLRETKTIIRENCKPFKENGVYLITGGAGSLGLIMTEYISKETNANIIVTGRSALEGKKLQNIEALKSKGAKITYIQSDITNEKQVVQLYETILQEFEHLNGIIHSAGTLRDSLLINKTQEDIHAVLRPKISGAILLDRVMQKQNLDFFVMFSSAVGMIGNIGQVDYAFANSYLNHFARWRDELVKMDKRKGKTISICWPFWEGGGMTLNLDSKKWMAEHLGWEGLSNDLGFIIFKNILEQGTTVSMILHGDHTKIINSLGLDNSSNKETLKPASDTKEVVFDLEQMEVFLKQLFAKETKLPIHKIETDTFFEDYGIESVMIVNITRDLENTFGKLSKTLLFEYRSIDQLITYLIDNHLDEVHKKFKTKQSEKHISTAETSPYNSIKKEAVKRWDTPDNKIVNKKEPIAIVGLHGIYPGANSIDEFWELLKNGVDAITEIPKNRWDLKNFFDPEKGKNGKSYTKWGGFIEDIDKFDSLFFNISPLEAKLLDPQERLFLETSYHALQDAGYTRNQLKDQEVGVFVGAMYTQYQMYGAQESFSEKGFIPNSITSSIANRVSYYFDLNGPSLAIDTMCSSSHTAIHLACKSLQNGECNMAIAGGVNITSHPYKYLQLSHNLFASTDGKCRAFGEGGDGYVPGEGVGALILKPLSQALSDKDRIYGTIIGTAINHGGRTNGYSVPNPLIQSKVIEEALNDAKIASGDINYIEAHGTGTSLGDPIEIEGLNKVFSNKNGNFPVGSVKSNIGHLESAAGIAAITKVLLQLKHKQIAPSIHSKKLNPNLDIEKSPFYIPQSLEDWKQPETHGVNAPRRAGISSFGAGGANAHIIIEEYEQHMESLDITVSPQIIVLSAKSEKKLKECTQNLLNQLKNSTDDNVDDLLEINFLKEEVKEIISNFTKIPKENILENESLIEFGFDIISLKQIFSLLATHFSIDEGDLNFLDDSDSVYTISRFLHERKIQPSKNKKLPYSLQTLSYNLQLNREQMEVRLAFIAKDFKEVQLKLAKYLEGHTEGLYLGSKQNKKPKNKKNSNQIEEWIQGEEWLQIISLWTSGIHIDWSLLYDKPLPKISMPLYPFEKRICWIPEVSERKKTQHHSHTDTFISQGINFDKEVAFLHKIDITKAYFTDHRVKGVSVMPGVGHIEMAIQAMQKIHPEKLFEIHNLVWANIWSAENEDVFIKIAKTNGEEFEFEIAGKDTTLSRGQFIENVGNHNFSIDTHFIKSNTTKHLNSEVIYKTFNEIGLNYGMYYQGVKEVHLGTKFAYGKIKLPIVSYQDQFDFKLHPSMADAALQVAACMELEQASKNNLRLPYAISNIVVLKRIPEEAFVYAEKVNNDQYDIFVLDDQENTCVIFKGLTVKSLNPVSKEEELADFFYKEEWVKLTPILVEEKSKVNNILVIKPHTLNKAVTFFKEVFQDARMTFAEPMYSAKSNVSNNCYPIDSKQKDSWINFLTKTSEKFDTICFVSNGYSTDTQEGDIEFDSTNYHEEIVLFYRLIKALFIKDYSNSALNIFVLTFQTKDVFNEPVLSPVGSELFGFCHSLSKEQESWNVKVIDLEKEKNIFGDTELFRKALFQTSTLEIAIRKENLYQKILSSVALENKPNMSIRKNGTYLILGGTGGIGFEYACHLSRTYNANIILLGRTPENENIQEKIHIIDSLGGKALYCTADASDYISMQSAVDIAKRNFGNIHGAIHSALVLRDMTIQQMEEKDLIAVLSPKTIGAINLYQSLKYETLDFLLFFSSAQSITGNRGQANYAAACTFKDAFALYLDKIVPYPVKIINWGFWGSIGIVATKAYREQLKAQGVYSIEPAEGMQAISLVLQNHFNKIVAIKAETHLLEQIGLKTKENFSLQENDSLVKKIVPNVNIEPFNSSVKDQNIKASEKLEYLGALLVLKALQAENVFRTSQPSFSVQELKNQLGVIPFYERLFSAILDILETYKFCTQQNQIIKIIDISIETQKQLDKLEVLKQDFVIQHPNYESHINLLDACVTNIFSVLRGEAIATDIMFPNSSMHLVEGLYKGNAIADRANQVTSEFIKNAVVEILKKSPENKKIRILEVGAGTGGTSNSVLKALRPFTAQIEYIYTDVSSGFLSAAKQKFGKLYDFITFQTLDIEKSIALQGIEQESIDLVFGSNVFHATENINNTLHNCKELLTQDGIILLNELMEVKILTTLTFGLLNGWWKYEDPKQRLMHAPLLDEKLWSASLREANFQSVIILDEDNAFSQKVIVAQKNETTTSIEEKLRTSKTISTFDKKMRPIAMVKKKTNTSASKIENIVVNSISIVLDIEKELLDYDRAFSEYGVDSITGVSLINEINEKLGLVLKTTTLFDYPNINNLVDFIVQNYSNTITLEEEEESINSESIGLSKESFKEHSISDHTDSNKLDFKDNSEYNRIKPISEHTKLNTHVITPSANKLSHHQRIKITKPGTIESIQVETFIPELPSEDEVQIQVKAFSLNFGDLLCVKGLYPTMPPYPFSPGFEIAGIVTQIGANVSNFQAGDEVIAIMGEAMGGQSTIVNCKEIVVTPKPFNISFEEACGFPIVFLTMYHAFKLSNVKKGEKVLIQTAAGGTGLISVQLAQMFGAEIYATAGSQEKLDYLKNMGVPHLINYREDEFDKQIRELTNGKGVDVVLNTLSGDAIQKGIEVLASGGRYVEIAMTGLKNAVNIDISSMTDNQHFISVDLRKLMLRSPEIGSSYMAEMVEILEQKIITPTISKIFPFNQIKEAYYHLEGRSNIGKVVVSVPDFDLSNNKDQEENKDNSIQEKKSRDIAIIGMAGHFPGAKNITEFWNNIANGINSVKKVPTDRWDADALFNIDYRKTDSIHSTKGGFLDDVDQFDAAFFNISGREALLTDPQQRLFLEQSWLALEDAGYANNKISDISCSVFAGAGGGDYMERILKAGLQPEPQAFWGNNASVTVSRLSYFLNLKGTAIAMNTACSSSLVATHMACQSIFSGESDMAIAGGAFVMTMPSFYLLNSNANMLSPDGQCKSFDNSANGYVPGEGVAAIILKSLDKALEDGDNIHGVIKASSSNQDGRTNGITAPSSLAQTDVELATYKKANINPETISYIETHGTGTKLGDPIEIDALTNAFREHTDKKQFCAIGSVKTNIGHTVTCAGVASIIKAVMALKNKQIPPSLNFEKANEHIDFDNSPFYVNTQLKNWETPLSMKRRAAVSSFGFSGTNAHMVIEEAPKVYYKQIPKQEQYLFLLSAKTPTALKNKAEDLLEYLNQMSSSIDVSNIAYTLANCKMHLPVRIACIAANTNTLIKSIKAFVNAEKQDYFKANTNRKTKISREELESAQVLFQKNTFKYELKELEELAQYYVDGYGLNWNAFFDEDKYQKINLPSYPFERKSYWVELNDDEQELELTQQVKETTTKSPSNIFKKIIKSEDPIVAHHHVDSFPVLPGVAHIELALQALHYFKNTIDYKLNDLIWLYPIKIENDIELHVELWETKQKVNFSIKSKLDQSWITHSTGNFTKNITSDSVALEIPKIKARLDKHESQDEVFKKLEDYGMVYGTFYQGLIELWSNNDETLIKIELPEVHAPTFNQYFLHPTIMDAALQGTIGIVQDTLKKDPMLPFNVQEIQHISPLSKSGYAYIAKAKKADHFNIKILDDKGNLCVLVSNLAFREYKKNTIHPLYFPTWTLNKTPLDSKEVKNKKVLLVSDLSMKPLSDFIAKKHLNSSIEWLNSNDIKSEIDYFFLNEIDTVYFIVGDTSESINDVSALHQEQEQSIVPLFRLVKAVLAQNQSNSRIQFTVVTSNSVAVNSLEKISPFRSGLFGFIKTMSSEFKNWSVDFIDIDDYAFKDITNLEKIAQLISNEKGHSQGHEIALRQGERYERSFSTINFEEVTPVFKQEGVYLIIGGAGAIGNQLSAFLAEKYKANIVWIGRRELTRDIKQKIDQNTSKGGKTTYLSGDATDSVFIHTSIQYIEETIGALNGVIHCAAVLKDQYIKSMQEQDFIQVFRTKTDSSYILGDYFKNKPLDFMVFFSSIQSFAGNVGQSNYGAACNFVDTYAKYLDKLTKYPIYTINWGLWEGEGLASDEKINNELQKIGLTPIQSQEGLQMFSNILSNKYSQVVACKATKKLLQKMGLEQENQIKNSNPKIQEIASIPVKKESIRKSLEQEIYKTLSDVLKNEQGSFNQYTPFSDFGVDSLLAVDIIQSLNKLLQIQLQPTDLFNYATVEKLTDYILEEFDPLVLEKDHTTNSTQNKTVKVEINNKNHKIQEQAYNAKANIKESNNSFIESENEDIAIIGMSGTFPDAPDIETFWGNLKKGQNAVKEISRWKVDDFYNPDRTKVDKSYCKWGAFIEKPYLFDPLFFNISPKEAELMDPQQRLFLMDAWNALEDAGYSDKALEDQKCSVYIGCESGDYSNKLNESEVPKDAYMFTGNAASILTARVSYLLNLKGASVPVDTACSSSLVAIHLACEALRNNTSSMAIAGGIAIMNTPEFYTLSCRASMLSVDGQCKTFDSDANGFVPGEAVGVIVLKKLKEAVADGDHIHAVIKGSGINQDGKTNGITAPSAPSQTALELDVYERFNINPNDISYVEAHGTGTKLGDPIEIEALTKSFREYTQDKQFCAIGSVKTNIGHTLTAAGISGVIKTVLCLKNKLLVPSLNLKQENPFINFADSPFYVNTKLSEWQKSKRIAAISSFGFSGTNAHLILEEAPLSKPMKSDLNGPYLFPFSAKTPKALKQRLIDISNWLDENKGKYSLHDLSQTLCLGRSHFDHRACIVASHKEELLEEVHSLLNSGHSSSGFISYDSNEKNEIIKNDLVYNDPYDSAKKFVEGYIIEWAESNSSYQKVPLPVYPFDCDTYDVPPKKVQVMDNKLEAQTILHPAIHVNASTLFDVKFKSDFGIHNFFLSDHQVFGIPTLPGVMYLEMARVAGSIAVETPVLKLSNIVWINPFRLNNKEQLQSISTILFPDENQIVYHIKNEESLFSEGVIELDYIPENKEELQVDLNRFLTDSEEIILGSDCYQFFEEAGLQYGPSFQSVKQIYIREEGCLAEIELPENQYESIKSFGLHPSILDAAFQSVLSMISIDDMEKGDLLLPFSLDCLEILGELTANCFVFITIADRTNTSSSFDIIMVNQNGEPLIKLTNLMVRKIRKKQFRKNEELLLTSN